MGVPLSTDRLPTLQKVEFAGVMTASRRWWLMAALLGLLLSAVGVAAQESAVEVTVVSPPLATVSPGQIVSLSFRVFNRGNTAVELTEQLRLPEGWEAIMPPGDFELAAREACTRLTAIQIPRTAAAGDYTVSFGGASRRDYALAASADVTLAVLGVQNLKLMLGL